MSRRLLSALVVAAFVAAVLSATAAERPAGAGGARLVREQTVYVPFAQIEDVFEKDGRGVYLPYARFLELWLGAGTPATPESEPPADLVVSRAQYTGTVEEGIVRLTATLHVEVLKKGWTAVPLELGDAAVSDARLDGEGVVLGLVDGTPHILASKPGSAALVLELTLPVATGTGERSFHFTPPSVPAARLDLRIPEADARVRVEPELPVGTRPDGAGTIASIALGGVDEVMVAWRARPQAASTLPALTFVTSQAAVRVAQGAVATEAALEYRILQAPVGRFRVAVPEGADLTAVDGEDIKDWTVTGSGAERTLVVDLREPVKGRYRLSVATEQALEPGASTVAVPRLEDRDARRQQGFVSVKAGEDLKVDVASREGCHQVDPSELPPEMAERESDLAFRFLRQPFALSLSVAPVEPRVTVDARALFAIDDDRMQVFGELACTVERAGVFRLRVDLPAGFEVRRVGSDGFVDDFHKEPGTDGREVLVIRLARKQTGQFSVPFELERPRTANETQVALPLFRVLDVQRERGAIGIAVRDRYRASTVTSEGLKPVDVQTLPALGVSFPAPERTTLVMGFRHEGGAAALTLQLDPRDSLVVASVETKVAVQEDVAKVTATVRYDVRYAAVTEVAFTLPSALDKEVRVEGDAVKERLPQPDPAKGLTTWRVTLQREIEGEVAVVVTYERKLGAREAAFEVAELVPLAVDRDTGTFAIVKAGNIESQVDKTDGLEPIDAKELPPGLQGEGIFQAFKYLQHPYSLSLKVTKHAYEPVLQALVDVALLETVVSDERSARTEIALLLQSNQRQYLELKLPPASEVLTAFVDGEMVRPARRDDGTLLLKMPQAAAAGDRRFIARLVYQSDLAEGSEMGWFGALDLAAPELPGVPVSLLVWRVWVPRGYRWFSPGGTMHEVSDGAAGFEVGRGQLASYDSVALVAPNQDVAVQLQGFELNKARIEAGEQQKAGGGTLPIQVRLVRQGLARDFTKLDGLGVV